MDRLKPSKERGLSQNCFFHNSHCVKSVRIRSYSGLHFPAFERTTERYGVSLLIQFKCGNMWTRIIPNKGHFSGSDSSTHHFQREMIHINPTQPTLPITVAIKTSSMGKLY